MTINLSVDELDRILHQIQQLKLNGISDADCETRSTPIKRTKSNSMYSLDQIDKPNDNQMTMNIGGKSMSNLNQLNNDGNGDNNRPLILMGRSSATSSSTVANNRHSYRRFAHHTNPEFSIESFRSKHQQARQYRELLDRQVEEKQRANIRKTILDRLKEAALDRKIDQQQQTLRDEFQRDHQFTFDDHKHTAQSTSKRSAAAAAAAATTTTMMEQAINVKCTSKKTGMVNVQTQTDSILLINLIMDLVEDESFQTMINTRIASINENKASTSSTKNRKLRNVQSGQQMGPITKSRTGRFVRTWK